MAALSWPDIFQTLKAEVALYERKGQPQAASADEIKTPSTSAFLPVCYCGRYAVTKIIASNGYHEAMMLTCSFAKDATNCLRKPNMNVAAA
jgi:hypothetical protein